MEERNRPTKTGQPKGQPKGHDASTPKYLLKRFANPDDRLIVVKLRPEPEVLCRQHPRRVGTHPELNTWRHEDGSSHDRLETDPLNRIDNAGADASRRVAQVAVDARTDEHLHVLDWPPDERVGLYLAIAGIMVRSEKLRAQLDDDALPRCSPRCGLVWRPTSASRLRIPRSSMSCERRSNVLVPSRLIWRAIAIRRR